MPENHQNFHHEISGDPDQGFAVVEVTTGNCIFPIQGAHVLITRNTEDGTVLFASLETGPDGKTIVIPLPAPYENLAMEPYPAESPYEIYFVRIAHPGYYTEENHIIQVFGGSASFLKADMIPLPENYQQGVMTQ